MRAGLTCRRKTRTTRLGAGAAGRAAANAAAARRSGARGLPAPAPAVLPAPSPPRAPSPPAAGRICVGAVVAAESQVWGAGFGEESRSYETILRHCEGARQRRHFAGGLPAAEAR